MKIQFDANQHHQRQAWQSAIKVFEGQELNKSSFSMPSVKNTDELDLSSNQTNLGYGNRLKLHDDEILANVQKVQLKNGLKQSESLKSLDFTIEMETGTGKTYVYLRSLFEMHKHFGFSKFIIVVPSIAIKEGVAKSLEMMQSHFKEIYNNLPFDYFIYDSNRLDPVRNFVSNDYMQIMVINIDAFRKSLKDISKETNANIIHRHNDKMQGKPIDFISAVNPIVIIDEPQSVDTTEKSAEAIKLLNPLCIFRYSATHITKHNMLYRIDSIDAYEQKLVKQIEVASIAVIDEHNKPYVKLISVSNKNGFEAKIELDIQTGNDVKRTEKTVKQGTDLSELSKRPIYKGYIINDIYCEKGNEYIDFTSNEDIVKLNHAICDVNKDAYKRLQISKTIEEHLNKELRLTPLGIKVLSLFFIDRVVHYRDNTQPDQKGKYAIMFEEEYTKLIKKPKYNSLFSELDRATLAQNVHEGYFSGDKKALKDTTGTTTADEDTYSLIMKDKEKLLSFNSKLKFIFSHSALKEGWDNPNVFQICTLNETQSTIKKRQEIGRGLRIAVNQNGERVHGFDVNTLTVMANESYETFVKGLQKEIEDEEGIKFDISGLNIKNNDDKRTITLNKAVFDSPDFKILWDKIKYKTSYNVNFDSIKFIKECSKNIQENLIVGKTKFHYTKAKTEINRGGVHITQQQESSHLYETQAYEIPDILSYLQEETHLKRKSLCDILIQSGRLGDLKNNPQKFINGVREIIRRQMQKFIVDGIKYQKIGNDQYYAQELFEDKELSGYLNKNMLKAKKSTYDHVVYDSEIESNMAKSFENNQDIKLYTKLPAWFKIDTPLGSYNPDWAVLFERDGTEKLYFVVETKGSIFEDMLRDSEKAKNKCGAEHFKALGTDTQYIVTDNYESFSANFA